MTVIFAVKGTRVGLYGKVTNFLGLNLCIKLAVHAISSIELPNNSPFKKLIVSSEFSLDDGLTKKEYK